MKRLRGFLELLAETGRTMVGQTSYRAYCAHMAEHHASAEVMDKRPFFRHRQMARYGAKNGGRCC
jgi:uncharacterized short protein YbdD (DUF466 family)